MSERQSSATIDDAAAAWVARIDRAPLTLAESDELDAWLAADFRRQGAFARARAVMVFIDRAGILGSAGVGSSPERLSAAGRHARWSQPSRRWALAAGGSIAAGVAAVTVGLEFEPWGPSRQYETERGEVRRLPLADGTVVTLNTATKLVVKFSKRSRNIQLIDGEVLFDVAKNPKRPFFVDAGDIRVRAVGTSFSVLKLSNRPTQVLVREGVVEITLPDGERTSQPVRVVANERALTQPHAPIIPSAVAPGDVVRDLSWQQGMVSFEGTSLQQAAEEFSRYSDLQITVDNPMVANETITGLFSATNPVGFAHAVALSLNLNVRTEGNTIHLSR